MSRRCRTGLREAIIETSLQLGSELGEEGLTMRGIAARLGVSATALYQHFESKNSILREIRFFGIERLWKALEGAFSIEESKERMAAVCNHYVTFARENRWLYTILMEHEQVNWGEIGDEEKLALLRPFQAIQESLDRGVKDGTFRSDLDTQRAAFQMWAAIHGLASLLLNGRIDEQHPVFPVSDEEGLIDTFVRALVKTATA